jgi:RHS repeat-associated protein
VTGLIDTGGSVVERYLYSAYGVISTMDGSFGSRASTSYDNGYTFTGRRHDPESGLFYYRHRFYQAELGRFLSRDPIIYRGGPALYQYVGDAPVRHADPLGLQAWPPGGGWPPAYPILVPPLGSPNIDVKGGSGCVSTIVKAMDTICALNRIHKCTAGSRVARCFDDYCTGKKKLTVLCPEELTSFGKLKCYVTGADAHTWPIGTGGDPTIYLCPDWDIFFGDQAECLLMHEMVHGCGIISEKLVDSCVMHCLPYCFRYRKTPPDPCLCSKQ